MRIFIFLAGLFFSIQGFSQENRVKIYPFKSAVIEYKYEAACRGSHFKFIDDYGYRQADYFYKDVNGEDVLQHEIIILIGAKAYTVNLVDSTVAIGRNSTYDYYLQYPDKTGVAINEAILKNRLGYQLEGVQSYLDKDCKEWRSGKSMMLTWNGLELKSETNFFMMMVEKATKLELNKKIPDHVFEIPKNLTYISSDVYQGFSGIELNSDTLTSLKNESEGGVKIEFSSASLGETDNFNYYNTSGQEIRIEGVNDYNKVDLLLIKSQQNQLASTSVEVTPNRTVIYQTTSGDYGKMQLVSIEEGTYLIRYVLFNNDGLMTEYSNGEASFLAEDFDFININSTNKLELIPKKKARCYLLGEF